MAAPKDGDIPATNALDAELARLRAAGLTDEEITNLLTGRRIGAAQSSAPGAAVPQSPVSGVMNNFSAIWTHARNIVPTMVAQIVLVFDTSVTATARITALLAVIVKAAFVLIFAYVVSLEFSQLRSATDRAHIEACTARATAQGSLRPILEKTWTPEQRQRFAEEDRQWKQDCQ